VADLPNGAATNGPAQKTPGGEAVSDDEPGGTIIHMFGPPPAVEGAPVTAERKGFCYPHWPVINEELRTVSCRKCKAPLDPIAVLLEVSRKHNDWVRLGEETRTMRKDIEALKAEEKRVKARTQSHGRKDAAEAVAAERAKLAARYAEIACRTDDARRALKRIDQLIARDLRERRAVRAGRP
jgi:hypothetical protein